MRARIWLPVVGAALTLCLAATADAASPFRHGVNVTRLFDTPDKADPADVFAPWTREVAPAELQRLRATGFDFIRLPVDPGLLLQAPVGARDAGLAMLFDFLHAASQDGLAVIVDFHPRPGSPWSPAAILTSPGDAKFVQYTALVRDVAAKLQALRDPNLALELMNEPQSVCAKSSGIDWTVFQNKLYSAARASAPSLNLVLTGGCNSSVDGLSDLDLSGLHDPNVYVMVHFYEPHLFTHQGAPWSPLVRGLAGLRYPPRPSDERGTEAATTAWIGRKGLPPDTALPDARHKIADYYAHPIGADQIRTRLGLAAQWADRMGIARDHVVLGEFGVMVEDGGLGTDSAAMQSRASWLHDVSHAADALGFGWAVWGYHGEFGIVSDDPSRTLDPSVTAALFG